MLLKRLSRLLAIIAVTLLGLGLRLDAISKLPIDYDEDDSAISAARLVSPLFVTASNGTGVIYD